MAFCRALNVPTRYCTGYVSFIGEPEPHPAGDFAAWMEVYLGGRWHVFDPRNNSPRIGRVMVAYGRDAADVPRSHSIGSRFLRSTSTGGMPSELTRSLPEFVADTAAYNESDTAAAITRPC